jgi:hypothetical protein
MSQEFSDGSQLRPWQAQSHRAQCSQVQLAEGDGARRTLAGNGLDADISRSSWPNREGTR